MAVFVYALEREINAVRARNALVARLTRGQWRACNGA
jgi:hypothetical protein